MLVLLRVRDEVEIGLRGVVEERTGGELDAQRRGERTSSGSMEEPATSAPTRWSSNEVIEKEKEHQASAGEEARAYVWMESQGCCCPRAAICAGRGGDTDGHAVAS